MGGKKGGIFEEWFRNISVLIFLQSFHAIFLAFVCELIHGVSVQEVQGDFTDFLTGTDYGTDGVLAILTIVSMTALIKMEKMIKEIFGIKGSKFVGGIGENFAKSMAGIKSAASMGVRTAKPIARTAQLHKEGKLNAKSIIDTIGDIDIKKGKVKQLEGEAPVRTSGETDDSYNRRKDQYNEKLKQAREDVAAAEKDLYAKQEKQKKIKADLKKSSMESVTTVASTTAATAFGIGASETIADSAILANATDKVLDSIAGHFIKDNVYGKSSNEMQQHINNLNSSDDRVRAGELVQMENPGLERGTAEFEAKVDLKVKSKDFEKQVKAAIKEAQNTKFEIDMEVPTATVRNNMKAIADTYREAGTAFSDASRQARATARDIRDNGISYKGHRIDDVGDI